GRRGSGGREPPALPGRGERRARAGRQHRLDRQRGSAWTTVHRGDRTDPGDFWPSSTARAELAARASAAPALTYCRFAIADCGWAVVARINPQSAIRSVLSHDQMRVLENVLHPE